TKESAYINLAADILGAGKNSPLYQELVYKAQIASSASAHLQAHTLAGMLRITVMLKPGADEAKANAIIDKVLADFLENGPTTDQLERAQMRIHARTIRGLEQIGGFGGKATALARGELYADDPGFYKTRLAWIANANTTNIKTVANKWFTTGAYNLTVRPFAEYTTTASSVDRSTGLPEVGKLPEVNFPEIQRATLKNGINVILAERHAVPVINIALQFNAGYAADSTGAKLGTSSFAMSMLDEGTKTRSALDISIQKERLGANISSSSSLDTSNIQLNTLTENLRPALKLMADIALNPVFDKQEIERLRGSWIAGIQQEKVQPIQTALRMLPPLLYGSDHAYGIPFTGSGTEASIADLNQADLIAFHNNWIRPDNVSIFVAGDTTMQEILPLLEKEFGKWKASKTDIPKKQINTVALPKQGRIIIVDKPDAPQSLILAGSLAPSTRADNNLAIGSMNDIIGGNFNARVNMNLREDKHWAYGAYTFMQDAEGQRPFMVYAPVQTDKTAASIKELVKELVNYIGDKPATADELRKTVQNNVNSLPGQFESTSAVLASMLSNARFDRPDNYVSSLTGSYRELKLESIQGAAEEVIHPDQLTWLIVGDRTEIEKQLSEADLNLGEITVMDADGNTVD
ncbi:MAG: insulinase family protein, partial [Xanthomonadales bacterium]|nr:insulinase family protein [Xanthomonadales bacterium]